MHRPPTGRQSRSPVRTQQDYLRLEKLSKGPASVDSPGYAPLSESASGVLRTGTISVVGPECLALSFRQAESVAVGSRQVVEVTSDLVNWAETPVVVLSVESTGGVRTTTVREPVPVGSSAIRLLRLRITTPAGERASDNVPGPEAY